MNRRGRQPVLRLQPVPVVRALSLWTGWTLTLAAAEVWIRYTRGARERSALRVGPKRVCKQ